MLIKQAESNTASFAGEIGEAMSWLFAIAWVTNRGNLHYLLIFETDLLEQLTAEFKILFTKHLLVSLKMLQSAIQKV